MKKIFLIVCEIFKEDLAPFLRNRPEVEALVLDMGLHAYVERLERELDQAIDRARAEGAEDIRLVFGWACLPDMREFAKRKGVTVLKAQNCLAVFVGDKRLKELEQNRTMVITRAWLKLWPEHLTRGAGLDVVSFRQQCGYYDRVLLLDSGPVPPSDEEILNFFEVTGVPIEVMPITDDFFNQAMEEFLS